MAYQSLIDFADSWASAKFAITPYGSAVLDNADLSAISHSGTVEVGVQKSGGRVKARTQGDVTYEASATFYRRGLLKFVRAIKDAAPDYAIRDGRVHMSLVGFDVDIHHSPPGQAEISHVRIKGCRLLGYSDAMTEGPDADQVELTLNPIEVVQVIDGVEVLL
jgi:hypothetical protein